MESENNIKILNLVETLIEKVSKAEQNIDALDSRIKTLEKRFQQVLEEKYLKGKNESI